MQPSTIGKCNKAWQWFIGSLTNHNSVAEYFEPLIQWTVPGWRTDLVRTRVHGIRYENKDMFSLILKPNSQWQGFEAGQYIELTVEKDGAWVSRYFSVSSSPTYFQRTGLIELSIRIQEKGNITPWLANALHRGSIVNISQAKGEFTLPTQHQSICMIAGGSGITPFRSMLQQLSLSQANNPQQSITLLYYARSAQHFLFKEEFKTFEKQNLNFHLKLMDSEVMGNVTSAHIGLQDQLNANTHFYICGPSPMILLSRRILESLNTKPDHVHYEFFGPEPLSLELEPENTAVLFDRSHKQVENNHNQTLLELAESNAIKPVSGCRIGVCHQCICQKKSGIVYNTKTKAYSDTGAQEIQLCISVPVNDVVLDL
jgi:ferredoxin-NADP reductase